MPDLDARRQLAVILRVLAAAGYDDKLAGHVSIRDRHDGTLWCNPYGLFWDEVRASDVIRVDDDGCIVEGPDDREVGVNPTIVFHLELHRARPDIACAIHSHPPYGTIWAAAGELPPLLDQTGANGGGRATVYQEYEGAVMDRGVAARLAAAYDDADLAILSNHGTLVTGPSPAVALVRAQAFEWRCRKAFEVRLLGTKGIELPAPVAESLAYYAETYGEGLMAAYARRLAEQDPAALA